MRSLPRLTAALFGAALVSFLPSSSAAEVASNSPSARLSAFDQSELVVFERKATLAKKLGATHVPLTDGLPPAKWQFVPADDPYPGWFIQRPDFLKLYPPAEVRPYVDMEYGHRVASILEERSRVLRRLGLKAHWGANIPQVMPEAFFTAYPHLRGPRVDQPNRSRIARFSMCVDQPETVRLYTEAIKTLLTRCPEIESFAFLTQDSGAGFCWLPSLYPGLNGHSDCRERPVSERISSFLVALQNAAKETGHDIEIALNPVVPRQWMIPSFGPEQLEATLRRVPRGIAIQGREGPDGRPYRRGGPSDAYSRGAFYPVVGVALPSLGWLRSGRTPAARDEANSDATATRRLISLRPDEAAMEFNARVFEVTQTSAGGTVVDRLAALRAFAAKEVGEGLADELLQIWLLLDSAEQRLDALDFGDMLQFGHVLNRWVNRPMVPFPSELSPEEKGHYRPFLFQAKGEEQAENLIDIQAMRMYEGFGARLLFQRVVEITIPEVQNAARRAQRLRDAASNPAERARWDLFGKRLEAVICLLHSADNMVAYQAQLDRVRAHAVSPEPNPPLGTEASWDRTDMMRLAREEIDNTVRLKRLLESTREPLLDLAPVRDEETIMKLGPDLVAQLQRKIDIMNAHWKDYDRLFAVPNP